MTEEIKKKSPHNRLVIIQQAKAECGSSCESLITKRKSFCFVTSYTPPVTTENWTNPVNLDWVIEIINSDFYRNFELSNDYIFIDCNNIFSSNTSLSHNNSYTDYNNNQTNLDLSLLATIISGGIFFAIISTVFGMKILKNNKKQSYDKVNNNKNNGNYFHNLELQSVDTHTTCAPCHITEADHKSNLISQIANSLERWRFSASTSGYEIHVPFGTEREKKNMQSEIQDILSGEFQAQPLISQKALLLYQITNNKLSELSEKKPDYYHIAKDIVTGFFESFEQPIQQLLGRPIEDSSEDLLGELSEEEFSFESLEEPTQQPLGRPIEDFSEELP